MWCRLCYWVVAVIVLSACAATGTTPMGAPAAAAPTPVNNGGTTMQVTSPAFKEGETIPKQYTCDGANISPALAWTGVPATAKTLALIVEDPDAPSGTWIHWVLFNISTSETGLAENILADKTLPKGALSGTSSFKKLGYGGPCPPSGTHRYYFKLYAIDGALSLANNATAQDVEAAMAGHVVGQGQLMGRYKR
jgi:Raf kinase inhibitor-like YbhB/YbcL family protein